VRALLPLVDRQPDDDDLNCRLFNHSYITYKPLTSVHLPINHQFDANSKAMTIRQALISSTDQIQTCNSFRNGLHGSETLFREATIEENNWKLQISYRSDGS
jgi:hypothetical protein